MTTNIEPENFQARQKPAPPKKPANQQQEHSRQKTVEGGAPEAAFLFDPANADQLQAQLTRLNAREIESFRMRSIYLDTPAADLRKHGFIFLFQRIDPKTAGAAPSIKSKGKAPQSGWKRIEKDVPPVPGNLRKTSLKSLLRDRQIGRAIGAAFTTEVVRSLFYCTFKQANFEMTLDHGAIRSGETSLPIHEIRLARLKGNRKTFERIERDLQDQLRLQPITLSLEERGYLLLDQDLREHAGDTAGAHDQDMGLGAAFRNILHVCIQEVQRCEETCDKTLDERTVRRYRRAIERLRHALSFFESLFPPQYYEKLKSELDSIAAPLQRTSSLYMLVHAAAELSGKSNGLPITDLLARINETCSRELATLTEQAARRANATLRGLSESIEEVAGHLAGRPDQPILKFFIKDQFEKRIETIKQQASLFDTENSDARAGMRHSIEELQTATDLMRNLLKRNAARKRHKALIDVLDDCHTTLAKNDTAISSRLLMEIASEQSASEQSEGERKKLSPEIVFTAGFLAGHMAVANAANPARTRKAVADLAAVKPFWDKLG
jgi:inorganic triphosphatase YgiF